MPERDGGGGIARRHANALTNRSIFYVLEVIAPACENSMSKFPVPVAPLACAIALTLGLGLAGCKKTETPAAGTEAAAPAVPAGPSDAEKAAAAAAAQQA